MSIIPPGGIIGIIGGGQLGRMTALEAANMGYRTHIFCPYPEGPAAQVSNHVTVAEYDDRAALQKFAEAVDVITFEFENIPYETVDFLEKFKPVRPRWNVLHTAQHRLREKDFCRKIGGPVAAYVPVTDEKTLNKAWEKLNVPKAVLKTAELGYDGKGQAIVTSAAELEKAWVEFGKPECILEAFVPFVKEISVIIARGPDKSTAIFPIGENTHVKGILDTTVVPANIGEATGKQAKELALKMADKLSLVGILAVELFVLADGNILFNEIAPRPHNSGHWTQDGCVTSQFEQFVRAVCGLPLGSTEQKAKVRMKNLIGQEADNWQEIVKDPAAKLHLYGKKEARPGRKMGHVNYVGS